MMQSLKVKVVAINIKNAPIDGDDGLLLE